MALIKGQKKERFGFSHGWVEYGVLHLGFSLWFWFWTCSECETKFIEIDNQIMCNGQRITVCPYCKNKVPKGVKFN